MKNITFYILISITCLILSCQNKTSHQTKTHGVNKADASSHSKKAHKHGEHKEDERKHDEGIHLTQTQIETIGLKFGDFTKIKINDFINATGTLDLPPGASASVSAKSSGIIRNNQTYLEGSYIKKGALIAYLENPEFIIKQQKYLEIKAELTFLRQELTRQKSLFNAQAGVQKNVQKMQADVAIKQAQLKGMEKYLNYLGIGVNQLTINNIQQQIPIVAPISGYLTSINIHNGLYVKPAKALLEILDDEHSHLELNVFEKDIAYIQEGQKITYQIPALGVNQYQAQVHLVGKEFDKINKTIRVHGHVEGKRPKFIKDLFVKAKVWLNDQNVTALPENAVIKDGISSFIYVGDPEKSAKEVVFKALQVTTGASQDGYVAVKLVDKIPAGMRIVVKGAYYVQAQAKAGELKHEH